MHSYRSHTCGELKGKNAGEMVRLSGWVHRKRDHGNLLFIDLRDHYGLTQIVIDTDSAAFEKAESVRVESVITIDGKVVNRTPETVNSKMATGDVEIVVEDLLVQSCAEVLPLQVNSTADFPEETRLTYRFLDLRREKLHQKYYFTVKGYFFHSDPYDSTRILWNFKHLFLRLPHQKAREISWFPVG